MKTVCVITSTRADYGIFRPLLIKLKNADDINMRIIVTGMHLCSEFGSTYTEIEKDGFDIHKKIDIQLSADTRAAMSKTMGMAMICFADYFQDYTPDLLVLLGDRYEIMAAACAAVNQGIPIAHIHGGETTEGAVDESFRHAITKMSVLHFTSCETYRNRVIQLGEQPDCVYNVGAMSVENILGTSFMTIEELSADLQFALEPSNYCVITFHPVTLESDTGDFQLKELISAINEFPQMRYIITGSNSDAGGRKINALWEEYQTFNKNCLFVTSLGIKKYLSALKYCAAMIGNSSSGILEGPALKIPTVNIGDRQKGRVLSDSVINCKPISTSIIAAMKKALSSDFRNYCRQVVHPYGDGNTSEKIINIIKNRLISGISLKKSFYDIERV